MYIVTLIYNTQWKNNWCTLNLCSWKVPGVDFVAEENKRVKNVGLSLLHDTSFVC